MRSTSTLSPRTRYGTNYAYPVDATYSSLAQSVASFISKVVRCPIRAKLAVAVCRRFRERCWNSIEPPTYEDLYRGEWRHPKLTEVAEVASTG